MHAPCPCPCMPASCRPVGVACRGCAVRYYLYFGCGGVGPVAAGPRGVLFNEISLPVLVQYTVRWVVLETAVTSQPACF